jgi:hypothetical protein
MADYKELLRRAIDALPENNGAARRAVYEKARSALVGQLRAIDPPLPAREITQHRLQLEDCIRQVEQEASEAVIAGLRQHAEAPFPKPPPVPEPMVSEEPVAEAEPEAAPLPPEPEVAEIEEPEPAPEPEPDVAEAPIEEPVVEDEQAPADLEVEAEAAEEAPEPAAEEEEVAESDTEPHSIEDIIAANESAESEPVTVVEAVVVELEETDEPEPALEAEPDEPAVEEPEEPRAEEPAPPANDTEPVVGSVTSIVARAEANKSAPSSPLPFRNPLNRPFGRAVKGPTFEPRGDVVAAQRIEPAISGQVVARQQVAEPLALLDQPESVALSSVREVDLEPSVDPQKAIDRAIETLDREARGETRADDNATSVVEVNSFARPDPVQAAEAVAKAPEESEEDEIRERGGGGALTIFLLVFAILLAGAGGAGYWAWHEGYVDPAAMFGQGTPVASDTSTTPPVTTATPPVSMTADTEPPANNTAPSDVAEAQAPTAETTGPGNTATSTNTAEPTQELTNDDRLMPDNDIVTAETNTAEPTSPANESKDEERLPTGDAATPPATPTGDAALDAATLAGSQSLLLEASEDGTTGAVPFTGTVEWSEATYEIRLTTLIGKANIPARNLGVDVLISKNSDPSLPASHLMEINFNVSETFMGGSIAGLPGVLLKNEELVQGTPLIGASARVVGNSFLFALSASPDDATTNNNLLTTRKWMDLALIYATGKRAIITLEKDDKATALFTKVFAEWAKASPAAPAAPTAASDQQG